jgi:hypothetical protein
MVNAREEFLEFVESVQREVLCAKVTHDEFYGDDPVNFSLKRGYSDSDYKEFLSKLNLKYDAGYGVQELIGRIWFTDGTWADRDEYDGSEWWVLRVCPKIDF